MDRKTIILIIIILVVIYFGYKMRTEYMTKEEENALTCKWIDTNGVVHNPTAKECYQCYECINNKSGQVKMRLNGDCIAAANDDRETQGNFNKYSDNKRCSTF